MGNIRHYNSIEIFSLNYWQIPSLHCKTLSIVDQPYFFQFFLDHLHRTNWTTVSVVICVHSIGIHRLSPTMHIQIKKTKQTDTSNSWRVAFLASPRGHLDL